MKDQARIIRAILQEKLPKNSVTTAHTKEGHFYKVGEETYPSVTGLLQLIKDEGLMNWKMNRAVDYIFAHYKEFTDENILQHLDTAKIAPAEIFEEAGHIGTFIHDCREAYFKKWIELDEKPQAKPISFIPIVAGEDLRTISALRALEKFVTDYDYWPVACELYVYDSKLKCGGTLDDLGLIRLEKRKGVDPNCFHDQRVEHPVKNKITCMRCGQQITKEFYLTLLDIKTSNQFKDHYFFQVGMYYKMFYQLTGLRPRKTYILKLSKENGIYKLEDLRQPSKLASYAASIMTANKGLQFIKSLRKDNLKKVGKKIEL